MGTAFSDGTIREVFSRLRHACPARQYASVVGLEIPPSGSLRRRRWRQSSQLFREAADVDSRNAANADYQTGAASKKNALYVRSPRCVQPLALARQCGHAPARSPAPHLRASRPQPLRYECSPRETCRSESSSASLGHARGKRRPRRIRRPHEAVQKGGRRHSGAVASQPARHAFDCILITAGCELMGDQLFLIMKPAGRSCAWPGRVGQEKSQTQA
jgi:hypothetical protein